MAVINNWQMDWKRTPSSDMQSGRLREQGNQSTRQDIRVATHRQVQEMSRTHLHRAQLKLAPEGFKKIAVTTDFQATVAPQVRASNTGARQVATHQAGQAQSQQRFIETRDASRTLHNLVNKPNAGLHTATKGAVASKGAAAQVQTHRDPGANTTPVPREAPVAPRHAAHRADNARGRAKHASAQARRARGEKAQSSEPKAAELTKSLHRTGAAVQDAHAAAKMADAAAKAAASGAVQVKGRDAGDGSTARTDEKKQTERKGRTSSLAKNEGKANASHLGRLLDGGGFDANVDVTAQDTAWQASDSDAIGAHDTPRASLMDDNAVAKTFTLATPQEHRQHEIWNRTRTFISEVIKPRLKEIADLNEKLGERLDEIALSEKVSGDPELKELFMSRRQSQLNPYGGMSA